MLRDIICKTIKGPFIDNPNVLISQQQLWIPFKKKTTENVICFFSPAAYKHTCGGIRDKEKKTTFENSFLIQIMFLARTMQQIGVAYDFDIVPFSFVQTRLMLNTFFFPLNLSTFPLFFWSSHYSLFAKSNFKHFSEVTISYSTRCSWNYCFLFNFQCTRT